MGYFDQAGYLSVSRLKSAARFWEGREELTFDSPGIALGHEVDAILTEGKQGHGDAGAIAEAVRASPYGPLFSPPAKLQKEFYRTIKIGRFKAKFRGKLDSFRPAQKIAVDLKTTAGGCATPSSCIAVCDYFGYWGQAWAYMELARCDKFIFVFASTAKIGQVVSFKIERGDHRHEQGREVIEELVEDYFTHAQQGKNSELLWKA
jgi:hypothetical protein